MDLIDTPNPNAKKVLIEHNYEIATYIKKDSVNIKGVAKDLIEIDGGSLNFYRSWILNNYKRRVLGLEYH